MELGAFPGLVRDEANGLAVTGEVWDVDAETLKRLDWLEGVPSLYTRGPIDVVGHAGVEAYFYARPVSADWPTGAEWPMPLTHCCGE